MKSAPISPGLDGQGWWRHLRQGRDPRSCIHRRGLWRRLGAAHAAVRLEGALYCVDQCLERALADAFRQVRSLPPPAAISHRIPLGLLLLSRQQLSGEQLRAALEAQRAAGRGRIGEWLQALGFVSEQQITAALARQWSCPILRLDSPLPGMRRGPQIPTALLERFVMIPVDYIAATSTLHLALGEGPDYSILYAIEKMLGCRTQWCMARPSFVRRSLEALSVRRGEGEFSLACEADAEFSRIVRSYCARLAASEVRLAACGAFVWVRLLGASRPPLDLWMHPPQATRSPSFSELPPLSAN